MSEPEDVQELLARVQHAEMLAAAEDCAAGKAAWFRVAALTLLLVEQLLVEEAGGSWGSGMTMQ